MSMEWIRKNYGVPAKRGGRVEYTGDGTPKLGTIVAARGGRLRIRLDERDGVGHYHPTWELRYLDAPAPQSREAGISPLSPSKVEEE